MLNLADIFTNHMVLQRRRPICFFGNAESNIEVTVSIFKNQECIQCCGATADNDGTFEISMPAMEAADDLRVVISAGEEVEEFTDVSIGEVWLAGGQSNMEYELKDATGGSEIMHSIVRPSVRFFYTPKCAFRDQEYDNAFSDACWECFEGDNAANWSAVGFWFAKELSEELGVTVGVIGCNWGGSVAFNWMSRENLISDSTTRKYVTEYETSENYQKSFDDQLLDFRNYEKRHAAWELAASQIYEKEPMASFDSVQERVGKCEYPGPMNECNFTRPYGLYNMMLSKIFPYTLGGVIYYQGESDEVRADEYEVLLTNLVKEWRSDFRNQELPFIIAQLPMSRYLHDSEDPSWSIIRENQSRTVNNNRNMGLAVCIDCGEFHQIHPVEKRTVAHRLFLQAMYIAYGRLSKEDASGPEIKSISAKNNSVRITFSEDNIVFREDIDGVNNYVRCLNAHPDEKIQFSLTESSGEQELHKRVRNALGFEIQSTDRKWYPAGNVNLSGDTIEIYSTEVTNPVAVRYLWKKYHPVFIFDTKGIPLAPFLIEV